MKEQVNRPFRGLDWLLFYQWGESGTAEKRGFDRANAGPSLGRAGSPDEAQPLGVAGAFKPSHREGSTTPLSRQEGHEKPLYQRGPFVDKHGIPFILFFNSQNRRGK